MEAFVKVIGQCQQVFWNLYLIIIRCLYLIKCEVNMPIAPKEISLGMKVLQLENRVVSLLGSYTFKGLDAHNQYLQ